MHGETLKFVICIKMV